MPEDGRIEITLRDIYDAQQQTRADVGSLGAQLRQLDATVTLRLDSGQRKMDDFENRLRAGEQAPKVSPQLFGQLEGRVTQLEKFRWMLLGAAGSVGALAGITAAIITHH